MASESGAETSSAWRVGSGVSRMEGMGRWGLVRVAEAGERRWVERGGVRRGRNVNVRGWGCG